MGALHGVRAWNYWTTAWEYCWLCIYYFCFANKNYGTNTIIKLALTIHRKKWRNSEIIFNHAKTINFNRHTAIQYSEVILNKISNKFELKTRKQLNNRNWLYNWNCLQKLWTWLWPIKSDVSHRYGLIVTSLSSVSSHYWI